MDLENINTVYFIGIGGIGMSALARYFKAMDKEVAGYDKTRTKLTDELVAEGIEVHYEDDITKVKPLVEQYGENKEELLVVYTPAVPKDHSELLYFKSKGFELKKRAQVLGMITDNAYGVAVAGTHGKTTTSSMIAHILHSSGVSCSAFLGGITQNYHSNVLLDKNIGDKDAVVVLEADEYDRSFLTLHPAIAVITSVDADHLDVYGDASYMEESYALFAANIDAKGVLITKESVKNKLEYKGRTLTYSLRDKADFYATNIVIEDGQYVYDVVSSDAIVDRIKLGLPGLHNVENSIAAVAVARQMGVDGEAIRSALGTFKGVRRRFDYQIKTKEVVFIDDYAHHPQELMSCINSVRELYPGKKITGIFQPHLYSRTRDFADDFARSLELLDELILLDIYPARELPIPGVSSSMLLDKVNLEHKMLCSKEELVQVVHDKKPEVLLTLGAGDIDVLVEPLKKDLLDNIVTVNGEN